MATKKYELLKSSLQHFGYGVVLRRIRATKNFGNVKAGDIGGWIENENNLSHEGLCWVYDTAMVYMQARVTDDSKVMGTSWVWNSALLAEEAVITEGCFISGESIISGNAVITGEACIGQKAKVYGDAAVGQRASVNGEARVYDIACVYGYAQIFGKAVICGNCKVRGNAKVFEGLHDKKVIESWSPYLVNVAVDG